MEQAIRIDAITGTALPLRGDDIDTDRIIPARYLRSITFDGLDRFVFEDDRKGMTAGGHAVHPFDDRRYRGASVLLVQRNFGCGSSREHAPQAIQRWGIGVIVGESFSDIFFGNSVVIGLPCVTASRGDIEALMAAVEADPSVVLRIDLAAQSCVSPAGTRAVMMPASVRDAFLTGAWDTTGLLLERFDEVHARAARLPYINKFG
jgi:3-isopropylmalate/(R)-2-methylmalate dehydratase small subunit